MSDYTPAKVKRCDNPAWLRQQLEHWPTRVDQACTTNIEFLMKAAAAEIDFLTSLQGETDSGKPHCDTCGADVHEILCPTCAKWWNDNPPMTDLPARSEGIVERLGQGRVILKSGDYDGADLMRAWCAMAEAASHIRTLEAENRRLREALENIAEGDYVMPAAHHYFPDKRESKHNRCEHDNWMYDGCVECCAITARQALENDNAET